MPLLWLSTATMEVRTKRRVRRLVYLLECVHTHFEKFILLIIIESCTLYLMYIFVPLNYLLLLASECCFDSC